MRLCAKFLRIYKRHASLYLNKNMHDFKWIIYVNVFENLNFNLFMKLLEELRENSIRNLRILFFIFGISME